MSHSFVRIRIHLVFSTKYREHRITDAMRASLHEYLATILIGIGRTPLAINSVEDHVHILFALGRTVSIGQVAEEVKMNSSKWIKTQGREFARFAWQVGYGAFSVSDSVVPVVCRYIARQREHHGTHPQRSRG